MTVLIALKKENGVLFTSDIKRSFINIKTGELLNVNKDVPKIFLINENILVSLGGDANIGELIIKKMQDFYYNKQSSTKESIEIFQKICRNEYTKYIDKKQNRFLGLYFFIGGYDKEKGESFLYLIKNSDQFQLNVNDLVDLRVFGEKQKEITNYIANNKPSDHSSKSIVDVFSAAIRSVNSPMLSKETNSILLEYNREKGQFILEELSTNSYGVVFSQVIK